MITELCKLRDVQRAMIRYEAAFEKKYGICLNEGMALCSLSNREKLTSGQLGQLLGLSHSNTSKIICSIEKKGYVTRNIGRQDKRKMYFSITREGLDKIESIECDSVGVPEMFKEL